MASLEQRNGIYRVVFRCGGQKFTRSLKTRVSLCEPCWSTWRPSFFLLERLAFRLFANFFAAMAIANSIERNKTMKVVLSDRQDDTECIWCEKQRECVKATFSDGFVESESICWKCLAQAFKVRSKGATSKLAGTAGGRAESAKNQQQGASDND